MVDGATRKTGTEVGKGVVEAVEARDGQSTKTEAKQHPIGHMVVITVAAHLTLTGKIRHGKMAKKREMC